MASDIKTLHFCCSSAALVFDTTSPSAKACAAGTGSVGRSSEPQLASLRHGRLTPARISPGCPPCLRLGLGRSIIVPDGVVAKQPATGCFVDGWTRLHLVWPSLIDVGQPGCQNRTEKYGCLRLQPCAVHLQVVLAHPPASLALVQRAPSGKYPDDRVFCFQGTTEKLFLLACIGEEVRILATPKFKFSQSFFEDPEYPHLPLVYRSA